MIENNNILEVDVTMSSELQSDRRGLPGPEHALLLAVLEDATRCFLNRWDAANPKDRQLHTEARDWFRSTRCTQLYDFENVCNVLGIDAGYLRGGLFRELERRRAGGRPRAVTLANDDPDLQREAG
jgi:hypothetical protein